MANSADLHVLVYGTSMLKDWLTKFPPTRNHRRPSKSVFGPLGQLVTNSYMSRGRVIQDKKRASDRNGPRLYSSLSAGKEFSTKED